MATVTYAKASRIYPGTDRPAVDQLDLEIQDGEFLVLVGPSGCGKSTSLRMLAGLEEVDNGAIYIDDRDVTNLPPKSRDIAMVFQNYALYPHMSVAENMGFALKLKGVPKEERMSKVRDAAKLLDLENFLERKPKALSGGQRQRVAMGRAIVREPSVFLMDEPLSNLDAKLRVQTRAELIKLHTSVNTTTIYVTHDQVEAMTLAHRMLVMNAGRAEQIGTPMEVYENPATVFVAGFIGSPAMNFLPGRGIDGNRVELEGAGILPAAVKIAAGQQVTVGLRPEHLTSSSERDASLAGTVEVVEALGADTLLHLDVAGRNIIARLPHGIMPAIGATLHVRANPDRVYLFDAGSGARLQ